MNLETLASLSQIVGTVTIVGGTGVGSTAVLVRTSVINDSNFERAEDFKLTAAYTSGLAKSATGTATIKDDGTGNVYPDNTTGATDGSAALDDDRALSVTDLSVNEASPYAVFTVTGVSGQLVKLELQSTGAGTGNATLGTDTGTALQYFNGTSWVDYSAGTAVNIPAGGSTLLVRVSVTSDSAYEGAETFRVQLANATSGATNINAARQMHQPSANHRRHPIIGPRDDWDSTRQTKIARSRGAQRADPRPRKHLWRECAFIKSTRFAQQQRALRR